MMISGLDFSIDSFKTVVKNFVETVVNAGDDFLVEGIVKAEFSAVDFSFFQVIHIVIFIIVLNIIVADIVQSCVSIFIVGA